MRPIKRRDILKTWSAPLLITMMLILVTAMTGCTDRDSGDTTGSEVKQTGSEEKGPSGIFPDKEHSKAKNVDERVAEILKEMTTSQKIGQVILARYPMAGGEELIRRYGFGGYILYDKDFRDENGEPLTAEQVKSMMDSLDTATQISPFLAVDEEGGTVVRMSSNPKLFPEGPAASPQEILDSSGEDGLYEDAADKNRKLKEYGINLNLGPVVDVPTDENSFMWERSMGVDAEKTAELTAGIVTAMKDVGMGSMLKHFPGYRNTEDTHNAQKGIEARSLDELRSADFLPFEAGIGKGADSIMMSHIYASSIDEELPVSLSKKAHAILRDEMGFEGVIVTDDLWMLEKEMLGVEESLASLALKAGNDMMISSQYEKDVSNLEQAVFDNKLDEKVLDRAVSRVIRMKLILGIIE